METNYYVVGVLSVLLCYVIYEFRKLANYFKDRNIPWVSPIWPLGSDVRGSLFRYHYSFSWDKIYNQLKGHGVGGFYFFTKPIVMVLNPVYISKMFTTDFNHFTDRGFYVDEKKNPLDAHIFNLSGKKWKFLRSKMSPIFKPEKLKWMFSVMKECSDRFVDDYFETAIPFNEDVDIRETLARFTTDVFSSCALGFETNSLINPDNKFREFGKLFFDPTQWQAVYSMAKFLLHKLMAFLQIQTIHPKIDSFFNDVTQQAFQHRLSTGYSRNDFIQLLLEIREKGNGKEIKHNDGGTENSVVDDEETNEGFEINDSLLAAQVFVLFIGGFETTTSTLNNSFYFLSQNPECQEKARQEAIEVLKSAGGTFTYDSLVNLKYLQNFINETLRLIPAVPTHFRICTKDYTFPDGSEIKTGDRIIIPFSSIHKDPEYFSDPDKFIPERFDGHIPPGYYTPFGGGQRICIGMRFALTELKLTLAKMLIKYRVKPGVTPSDPFHWHPMSFTVLNKNPLFFRFEKIQNEAY